MITVVPYKYYQEVRKGGAVDNLNVLPAPFSLTGASTNNVLAAGASGKIHRVMAVNYSSTGVSALVFKSANTTTIGRVDLAAAGNDKLIPWDAGYFETVAGEALTVDAGTTAITGTVYYVTYTP